MTWLIWRTIGRVPAEAATPTLRPNRLEKPTTLQIQTTRTLHHSGSLDKILQWVSSVLKYTYLQWLQPKSLDRVGEITFYMLLCLNGLGSHLVSVRISSI